MKPLVNIVTKCTLFFMVSKDVALKIQGYTMLWKKIRDAQQIKRQKLRTEGNTDVI